MSVASVAQLLLEQSGGGGGGVQDVVGGDGIIVDEFADQVFQVSNNGVLSVAAGSGISIDKASGDVEITNDGVLQITAGNGIDIQETSAGVFEITNIGGGFQPVQTVFSIAANTALTPVNTEFQIITQADNVIPTAGLYIVDCFFTFSAYDATGTETAGIESLELQVYYSTGGVVKSIIYPTVYGGGKDQIAVSGSAVVECSGTTFFGAQAKCLGFTGTATQIACRKPFSSYPPNFTFTQIA